MIPSSLSVKKRPWTRALTLGLPLALTGCCSARPEQPRTQAFQKGSLELTLAGMVGFVPERGGYRALLLEESDPGMASIPHAPRLEVECGDLAGQADREDCATWPRSTFDAEFSAFNLEDSGGLEHTAFEVRVIVNGQPSPSLAEMTGEWPGSEFESHLVKLEELAQGDLGRATLAPEELAEHTVAWTFLGGGRLVVPSVGLTGATWKFLDGAGTLVREQTTVGHSAVWQTEYNAADGVRVELWRAGESEPAKTIELLQAEGGRLNIALVNEPDLERYCADAEAAKRHFAGFYRLTEFARSPTQPLETLPLPESPDVVKDFCTGGTGNRRVPCMMALYLPPAPGGGGS